MKELQSPDAKELLRHDGANIASVIARLEKDQPKSPNGSQNISRPLFSGSAMFIELLWGLVRPWNFARNRGRQASMAILRCQHVGWNVASLGHVGCGDATRRAEQKSRSTCRNRGAGNSPSSSGSRCIDGCFARSKPPHADYDHHSQPGSLDQVDPEKDKLLAVQVIKEPQASVLLMPQVAKRSENISIRPANCCEWINCRSSPAIGAASGKWICLLLDEEHPMKELRVVAIVEGHGEYQSIRSLLTRVWHEVLGGDYIEVLQPIRQKRHKLAKQGGMEKAIQLAALKLAKSPGARCLGQYWSSSMRTRTCHAVSLPN